MKASLYLLWHFHQPYYFNGNNFFLPWVRLHAVKDYLDFVLILEKYPKVKHTINIVPSLFKQIDLYLEGHKDYIQEHSELNVAYLTIPQKEFILKEFFTCNYENMIKPINRFNELYKKDKSQFEEQDYLDLICLYNLTWIGPISRLDERIFPLFEKENFTYQDRDLILRYHLQIMGKIKEKYRDLKRTEIVEFSVSPFYHPILPLIIDTNSYLERNPNSYLPINRFSFPEDAEEHVKRAIEYYFEYFGELPKSLWLSEGSISDSALRLISSYGITTVATDEKMLTSIGFDSSCISNITTFENDLEIKFRDTVLSDKIGFEYSKWSPKDASKDFVSHVTNNSKLLGKQLTVILDGENCWEFYPYNGFDFLSSLFTHLSQSEQIETKLFSQRTDNLQSLNLETIPAGSWINANFDIWIGTQEDRWAWDILYDARITFEEKRQSLDRALEEEIYELLLICEGSDWFWWYGPEFDAPNRIDFDIAFRSNIGRIYQLMNLEIPEVVLKPIMQISNTEKIDCYVEIGKNLCDIDFTKLSTYDPKQELSSMGKSFLLKEVRYATNERYTYLSIEYYGDSIYIKLDDKYLLLDTELSTNLNSFEILNNQNMIKLRVNKFSNLSLAISHNNHKETFPIYKSFIEL